MNEAAALALILDLYTLNNKLAARVRELEAAAKADEPSDVG